MRYPGPWVYSEPAHHLLRLSHRPSPAVAPLPSAPVHRTLPPSPRSGHVLNSCLLLLLTIFEGKDSVILFSANLEAFTNQNAFTTTISMGGEDDECAHFTDEKMEVPRAGASGHSAGESGPLSSGSLLSPSLPAGLSTPYDPSECASSGRGKCGRGWRRLFSEPIPSSSWARGWLTSPSLPCKGSKPFVGRGFPCLSAM